MTSFWIWTLAGLAYLGFAALWAIVHAGARAGRRAKDGDGDEFTPSIERFGYVQDARNRGEL